MRVVLASLLIGAAAAAFAQPAGTFEVASIKPTDEAINHTLFSYQPGGGIRIEGATLRHLVQYAYNLREYQLSGATGWMTSERYTILAKGVMTEGPVEYTKMNDQQRMALAALVRQRMQRLLAERFQLTAHNETRQLPGYALVVTKGGHKLRPNLSPDGSPQSTSRGLAIYKGVRVSSEFIAQGLSEVTRRPVRDETGLEGRFDFELKWTPDPAPTAPDSADAKPAEVGPTLFTALQEQLGLKLEAKRGPVEILVIDRADRPSEN
jgi:uncharacterized protein (TIGR03435 family)